MHEPKTSTGGILHTPNNYAAPVRPGAPLLPSERRNPDGTCARVGDEALRAAHAAAAAAHLPDWRGRVTPHLLRHYCASQLYANGMDLAAIQEVLGHSWVVTTMNYARARPPHPCRGRLDRGPGARRRPAAGAGQVTAGQPGVPGARGQEGQR